MPSKAWKADHPLKFGWEGDRVEILKPTERFVSTTFLAKIGQQASVAPDLREVISAYQKCVAETVQRVGGVVASSPIATAIATPPWCWSPTGMACVRSNW